MNEVFWIPFVLALFLWLVGMKGGWRRLFFGLLLSYAAIILACQHYKLITNLDWFRINARYFQPQQQAALAFSLTLTAALIGLNVLYSLLWRPVNPQKASGGLLAFLRGVMLGAVGWILGVMLTLGLFPLARLDSLTITPIGNWYWNTARQTLSYVLPWVEPWLVERVPPFLLMG
jgi:hypothetical protein